MPVDSELFNMMFPNGLRRSEIPRADDYEALLDQAIHLFREDASLANFSQLLLMSIMTWAHVRHLAGIKGDDLRWIGEIIPELPEGFEILYEEHVGWFSEIKLIHEIGNYFRHPHDYQEELAFILQDPINIDLHTKFLSACEKLQKLSNNVLVEGGWVGDKGLS